MSVIIFDKNFRETMALRTVQKIVKEWKEKGELAAITDKRGGRSTIKTARTPFNIQMIREIREVDPDASIDDLAEITGIGRGSVSRIINHDLKSIEAYERSGNILTYLSYTEISILCISIFTLHLEFSLNIGCVGQILNLLNKVLRLLTFMTL